MGPITAGGRAKDCLYLVVEDSDGHAVVRTQQLSETSRRSLGSVERFATH